MAVIYLLFGFVLVNLCGEGNSVILAPRNNIQTSKYGNSFIESKQDIIISIMIHLDTQMTRKAPKMKGSKKKISPKKILRQVEKIFNDKTLNQRVHLKLVNVRQIGNKTVVAEENVSKYLQNYCNWQKKMKEKRGEPYFSVLLTGLDLYFIDKKGKRIKDSTGRGYMSKVCSVNKSCAIVKWDPKDLAYLLAHEIAHSMGVHHDGFKNNCGNSFIMSALYSRQKVPQRWSTCSRTELQRFLRSKRKSSCLMRKSN